MGTSDETASPTSADGVAEDADKNTEDADTKFKVLNADNFPTSIDIVDSKKYMAIAD